MRRLVVALALLELTACWKEPRAPRAGSAVPGTIWSTPAQLWRTSSVSYAMTVDGDNLMLGGANGWIGRFDLITGRMLQEHEYGKLYVGELIKLRDGRWLAVGTEDLVTTARVIDLTTHETTTVPLGTVKGDYTNPGAVMLDDGGIVITGPGLPLAVYDPATWTIREVLSSELSWSEPVASGSTVIAIRKAHAHRFEVGSTTTKDLGIASGAAIHGTHIATRVYESGKWFAHLLDETTAKTQRLPDETFSFAFDAEGKRFALVSNGVVIVRAVPGAKVIGRFDLGDAARDSATLVFDRERIIVKASSVIRVIDLASSAVSPAGEPPIGLVEQLTVDNQGTVLGIGRGLAWRFTEGKLTASSKYGDQTVLVSPPGELRRYATMRAKDDTSIINVHAVSGGRQLRSWTSPQDALTGWLGTDGTIALDAMLSMTQPSRLLRSQGDEIVEVIAYNSQANVSHVDVDRGIALLDWQGTIHMIALKDGKHAPHTLRVPRCESYPTVTTQTDGRRIAVYDTNDVIIYNSSTGEVVGSGHFPGFVSQVSFLPGGTEILVGVEHDLMLWNLATKEFKAFAIPTWQLATLSPDASKLALAFGDGRIALVDVAEMRAAMRPIAVPHAVVPATCPEPDPFEVPADERGEPSDSEEFGDEDGYDPDEDSGD